jgi:hypothetical protein
VKRNDVLHQRVDAGRAAETFKQRSGLHAVPPWVDEEIALY